MGRILMTGVMTFIFLILLVRYSATGSIFEGSCNIGNYKLQGSLKYDKSTGTYTLTGAGSSMESECDEFFMAWREAIGDFSFSARVGNSGGDTNPNRRMGLIVRESLQNDAKFVNICLLGNRLTTFKCREQNDCIVSDPPCSSYRTPDIIKIERIGSKIITKAKHGKNPEIKIGEIDIDFPETAYVGLFVCSNDPDTLETVSFSNVKFKKL